MTLSLLIPLLALLWSSAIGLAVALCVAAGRTDRADGHGRWLAPLGAAARR